MTVIDSIGCNLYAYLYTPPCFSTCDELAWLNKSPRRPFKSGTVAVYATGRPLHVCRSIHWRQTSMAFVSRFVLCTSFLQIDSSLSQAVCVLPADRQFLIPLCVRPSCRSAVLYPRLCASSLQIGSSLSQAVCVLPADRQFFIPGCVRSSCRSTVLFPGCMRPSCRSTVL